MKRVKKYIIILLIFVFWILLLALSVKNENSRVQKTVAQYVLIDPFHYWKYVDSKWQKLDSVNEFDEVSEEINWKKYNIFVNNQYYNTLEYVLMDGQEYYFDEETHSYSITQEKILLSEDTYFNLKEFYSTDVSMEDEEIINQFLVKYDHVISNLTVKKKYFVTEDDIVYIVSNYPSLYTSDNSELFYVAFYRRNNKDYLLLDVGYLENVSSYKLAWVLDIDNKFNNFVLSYVNEGITCYDMYEYQRGKFVKVVGT